MCARVRQVHEHVPLNALEALVQARMGWVNCAVSPFAVASRNSVKVGALKEKSALLAPDIPDELRLAG